MCTPSPSASQPPPQPPGRRRGTRPGASGLHETRVVVGPAVAGAIIHPGTVVGGRVEAGLIFCLAREFPPEQNEVILEKAIKYAGRGIVGIDLAGTEKHTIELSEAVGKYAQIFQKARDAGLGTTVHTGETMATSGEGVIAVIENLKPDRIGHGVRAAYNETATRMLADTGTILEICPTSNLNTRAVRHLEEFKYILGTFQDAGVLFTINTDGTYLCETNIQREFALMTDSGVLDHSASERARLLAFEASFI